MSRKGAWHGVGRTGWMLPATVALTWVGAGMSIAAHNWSALVTQIALLAALSEVRYWRNRYADGEGT